tara:strand:+ start:32 stop:211 length:180 start_codon:yes stop_codon:yes gene_type:complete
MEINNEEKDKCVVCKEDTPYEKETHVHKRYCYVEGAGQLCETCWDEIYNTKFSKHWYNL